MKKSALFICFLFLFSIISCATTSEPVKLAQGDFDLTGTWEMKEVTSGCGKMGEVSTSTMDITQDGDAVTIKNEEKDWNWTFTAVNGTITIPERQDGKVKIYEYQIQVHEGADTMTAMVKWNYDNQCSGTSKTTYTRK